MSIRITSVLAVMALAAFPISACGGGAPSGIAVESSGPVADVDVTQKDGQLVVRWEQTENSSSCKLDYELGSGATGTQSFGALTAASIVEQVFDVSGEVTSATLTCT